MDKKKFMVGIALTILSAIVYYTFFITDKFKGPFNLWIVLFVVIGLMVVGSIILAISLSRPSIIMKIGMSVMFFGIISSIYLSSIPGGHPPGFYYAIIFLLPLAGLGAIIYNIGSFIYKKKYKN